MQAHAEKRQLERVAIQMPVLLEKGRGETRDMSMAGIYFTTRERYTPGDRLRLQINLQHVLPEQVVPLEFRGRVLRVETQGRKYGVAAQIQRIDYLN